MSNKKYKQKTFRSYLILCVLQTLKKFTPYVRFLTANSLTRLK